MAAKNDTPAPAAPEPEKRKRGRPRKTPLPTEGTAAAAPPRKRGRPRKHPQSEAASPPRKRGRPRKYPLPEATAPEPRKRGRPGKSPQPSATATPPRKNPKPPTRAIPLEAAAQQADDRISLLVRELRAAMAELAARLESESQRRPNWNEGLLQRHISRMRLALELPLEDLAELETSARQRSRDRRR